MVVINDIQLDHVVLPNSHYGYSATRLDDLVATEYTIATIVADVSGSTATFIFDMEAAITRIVQACKFSPRADNLLLRLIAFDDSLNELHGFKLLENCHLADYGGALRSGGATALYDATENAVASTTNYAQKLAAGDFSACSCARRHRLSDRRNPTHGSTGARPAWFPHPENTGSGRTVLRESRQPGRI